MMATQNQYQWRRDKDGLGVWDHRGKVAVAGYGHSPVDRRWDEKSMDQSLGAYSIIACKLAPVAPIPAETGMPVLWLW